MSRNKRQRRENRKARGSDSHPGSGDQALTVVKRMREMHTAVNRFRAAAELLEVEYGIRISNPYAYGSDDVSAMCEVVAQAVSIVADGLKVAEFGPDGRRWTGPQAPGNIVTLHQLASDDDLDYWSRRNANERYIAEQQNMLERELSTLCGRPRKGDGQPCRSLAMYRPGSGRNDGFGCHLHLTTDEKRELEEAADTIERSVSCPGCSASAGEPCQIPEDGGLTPSQAGLKLVDGEWARVRSVGGRRIHLPRIESAFPSAAAPTTQGGRG